MAKEKIYKCQECGLKGIGRYDAYCEKCKEKLEYEEEQERIAQAIEDEELAERLYPLILEKLIKAGVMIKQ